MRIAVIGHVEHVTLGRVDGLIAPGDVVHLVEPRFVAAGGGGIAFAQLCRSDAEVHLFTAVGRGEAGEAVACRLASHGDRIHVHAARRDVEHPRVVVIVDREGRRTIVVTSEPVQPTAQDPLPWSVLAGCDAAYFTGRDPDSLRLARAARRLVVTARRSEALRAAGVAPDVIVGSVADPRENRPFDAYEPPPRALVLTDGPRPVRVMRAGGAVTLVDPPPAPERVVGDYGAGDSFAAALTFFLAHGLAVEDACRRAGRFGAAVLGGIDPLETQLPLELTAATPRDYASISPSARSLLLVKAQTTLPYAREAARLLFGDDALDASRREIEGSPDAERRMRHFEVRARSIDAALAALGATRVLEIASGLSLRGLAMAEREGMHYVDTDLPTLASLKAELVARLHPAPLAGTLHVQALDAMDAGAFAATVAAMPAGPLAVVEEGLLVYLDGAEKAQLAASIRQALLSRGGAWVTADVYVRSPAGVEPYRDPRTKAFVEKHHVDQNKFESFDAAASFFAEQGFAVARRVSAVTDDPWSVRETWMLLPVP